MHRVAVSPGARRCRRCDGRARARTNLPADQSCTPGGGEHDYPPAGVQGDDLGPPDDLQCRRMGEGFCVILMAEQLR